MAWTRYRGVESIYPALYNGATAVGVRILFERNHTLMAMRTPGNSIDGLISLMTSLGYLLHLIASTVSHRFRPNLSVAAYAETG